MKFPPASTYRSRIAKEAASSVTVPNRIAPRLSALTSRAEGDSLPMVVSHDPTFAIRARSKSRRADAHHHRAKSKIYSSERTGAPVVSL